MDLEWILAATAVTLYAVIGMGYLFHVIRKASAEWHSVRYLSLEKTNHVYGCACIVTVEPDTTTETVVSKNDPGPDGGTRLSASLCHCIPFIDSSAA